MGFFLLIRFDIHFGEIFVIQVLLAEMGVHSQIT